MTRKDFRLIADALLWARKELPDNPEARLAHDACVANLARALKTSNPRFCSDKFREACGGR